MTQSQPTTCFASPLCVSVRSTTFTLPLSCAAKRQPTANAPPRTPTATLARPRTIADPSLFPILSEIVNDKPLVYLDSAATSQKPRQVIDAILSYYAATNSNVHRGAHSLASRATDAFEHTRDLIANLINANSRDEVVYTRNATEAINLVANTWALHNLQKGDTIIVSVMEHHANLVPWQMIASRTGAKVVAVPLTPQQTYDIHAYKRLMEQHCVRLVACSHVSNVLGCINPVRQIVEEARKHQALVLLDACQSVPHMPVDVQQLDVDFLVASAHKMCGPTGVGFLYGKQHILEDMPPFLGGGEMIHDVFIDSSTYAKPPHKFEAGTPAIGEVVGFAAAIEYLQSIGMDKIHHFETEMAQYLYNRLTAFQEVEVYGPPPPRAALCAFNVKGVHSGDLAVMLDLEGVAVRSGHHCAQPLHRELGINSSARASLYIYNSPDEVDKFIDALKESVDLLGGTLTLK
ncbi:putative cysteine desulfurase [Gracilariopsis chorda]|uniref:cysteine desulfurase n=1 Tax=Gracilariopsis chorda TaxID=448386 RepID=A0A2V3ITM5_9FLOR|nr:putative cysteine desulfurase [Gracilariopsis chorda]|eukprot:PXF45478.1 putative cysteine desulfurase [Gracilariopsis chorda]